MKLRRWRSSSPDDNIPLPPEEGTERRSPEEQKERELRRRRLELTAALITVLVVMISSWWQLSYLEGDSWLFLVLLNINIILMLVVLFLVSRSVVKLFVERKRKIFGSRLRTRLVLAFISISFIPVLIMFLAANRVVVTSVDYWFKSQVENSMQAALQIGQNFYAAATERLRANAHILLGELAALPPDSEHYDALLIRHQKQSGLALVGFIQRVPSNPPSYVERHWHAQENFVPIWQNARRRFNWEQTARSGFDSMLWSEPSGDYVVCSVPVPGSDGLYLVTAESMGKGLLTELEKISQGFEEYSQLKNLKRPLKLSFSLVLGLLSLVVIFGSVWVAFRLSRQLTEPILALSRGTVKLARGELEDPVKDSGKDELGQLVASFNRMAQDVRESRERLTNLNKLLEERSSILQARNQYIETVLENIATGVVTLDAHGNIQTMNKAACTIFATSAKRWEGRNPSLSLQPEYTRLLLSMYESLRKHPDRPWQQELDFVRGGRHWKLLLHVVVLPGQIEKGGEFSSVVAVIEDITELARMQRFAAWQEVAKRIAHEIKNPLTPIKLSAQRLERKFSTHIDDPAFVQSIGLIIKEVERMQNMVAEFSSFAAIPEVSLAEGNLYPLLEELVMMFRTSHPRIDWQLDIPEHLPDMPLDAEAMHRVLLNLMGNAAEALGGETPVFGAKVIVRAELDAKQENLRVQIEDNGPGLPEEDAAKLFEPYYSRKPGGTGLGLSIVRALVQDHGGSIAAKNAPGGGALINMEFPLV